LEDEREVGGTSVPAVASSSTCPYTSGIPTRTYSPKVRLRSVERGGLRRYSGCGIKRGSSGFRKGTKAGKENGEPMVVLTTVRAR
jgi:hypothetical protein